MTDINASVFNNLAGANPALIARAVTLINNPQLTSLEPLRVALNSGNYVVRTATPQDDMRGNPVAIPLALRSLRPPPPVPSLR